LGFFSPIAFHENSSTFASPTSLNWQRTDADVQDDRLTQTVSIQS